MKKKILFLAASYLVLLLMGWGGTAVSAAPAIKLGRIPTGLNQAEANSGSYWPRLSGDGRYVAFCSHASNLVPNDTNKVPDTFVYDTYLGVAERVSVTNSGAEVYGWTNCEGVDISGDGRYVAFGSDTAELDDAAGENVYNDIFLRDRQNGTLTQITHAYDGGPTNGASYDPNLSADGRHIIFRSYASNLVPNDINGVADIFGYDVQTQTINLISVSTTDSSVNGSTWFFIAGDNVSKDGRYFVFISPATNLVEKYTNGTLNVYVHDRDADEDGVFDEPDPAETRNEMISINLYGMGGMGLSGVPSISQNGRYVVFSSDAADLVAGDNNGATDIFVRDRFTGTTEMVSLSSTGTQGTLPSMKGSISDDGRFVVMQSSAQLSTYPARPYPLIYLRDRTTGVTTLLSVSQGRPANNGSNDPIISANGRAVVFDSIASDLVSGDTNHAVDFFLYRQ
ncbi:MAG: PD40 domain-containing protein [Ardenticatenaceae bacterium]|nr:PD40 domain-containing protein [Ardenticatenaceae bacterium]